MIATADTEWRSRRYRDENEADSRVRVTVDGGVIVAELVELLFESRAGPVASVDSVSDTMVIVDFENWQGTYASSSSYLSSLREKLINFM